MQELHYALVDRASLPTLLEWVEQHDASAWCLFPAPVDEEFAQVAPYLVQLTTELEQYLTTLEKPWGFAFTSMADNKTLVKHLRTLLSVYIDENTTPTFFRFYDPRILWAVMDCLTVTQQYFFAGPMTFIQTHYPEQRDKAFESRPPMHNPPAHITLNREQYSSILAQCYQNLEKDVARLFYQSQTVDKKDKALAEAFAKQLVKQLSEWGISVVSDVKSIAQCCIENHIAQWENFPATWKSILSNPQHSAPYRVRTLIMNLGGSNEL